MGEYHRTIQSFDTRAVAGDITADTVLGVRRGEGAEGAAAMVATEADEAVDYVSIFGRMGENILALSRTLTYIWNGLTPDVKGRIQGRYLQTMKSLLLPAIGKTTSQRNYFYSMAIHQVYLLANNNGRGGPVWERIVADDATKNIVERYFAMKVAEAAERAAEEEKVVDDPRDAFGAGVEGELTGRNVAYDSFKQAETQIIDHYELLSDPEDQEIFYDYLIANLKLYFDKFEEELNASVDEPTNQAYKSAKQDMGEPADPLAEHVHIDIEI